MRKYAKIFCKCNIYNGRTITVRPSLNLGML